MKNKISLLVISTIFIVGCNSTSPKPNRIHYVYPDNSSYSDRDLRQNTMKSNKILDLRTKPIDFQEGFRDGCSTAKGDYAKNRNKFHYEYNYKEGWFTGVANCRY